MKPLRGFTTKKVGECFVSFSENNYLCGRLNYKLTNKMRKLFFLLLSATLAACSSQDGEDNVFNEKNTEVTLTFSPYTMEPLTRAATSIASLVSRLDVWLDDGTEVTALHQSSSDEGFGTVSITLNKTKTYTLTAVAHKAAGEATLTDGIVAFPDEKVTHAMVYRTTFSPATTTSINAEMQRIVGQLRFEIADEVPASVYTMKFDFGNSFTRWNVATATATNATERISQFSNFSRANDGTAAFTFYLMPTNLTDTDEMDITVTAFAQNGSTIKSRTFQTVPIKAGYKTTYHGQFFTDQPVNSNFLVDDWASFSTVQY